MGNGAKGFLRLVALLVLVMSIFGVMGYSATALSGNPSGGQYAQIGVDDLLDGSDDTIVDETIDDSLDIVDDLADDAVDDSTDVLDDLADDAVDDSLDVLPDGGDGSDDSILDDTIDDSLDIVDDAVDDSLDVLPDGGDGSDDSILDDTIDDSLDIVDDLADDAVDDSTDILDGGSDDANDDGADSPIVAAVLPLLTADICLNLDLDDDGVILDADAEAALQLDLDGDGTAGDLDDLLLVQLALNGGCDSLINPTLTADICLNLDLNDDGIISNAELDAVLLVDLDDDGTIGDLDDLLLVELAINGGCADDGGSGPADPPLLTGDICLTLDLDDDGTISDTELTAVVLVDVDGDGTIGDVDDLVLIQLAVNGGCADGGDPGPTDPPVLTADICLILDVDDNGIISDTELAGVVSLDVDGDGDAGDLDDLVLIQLAVNGGCADVSGPGPEETPVLTVDVCLLLDADADGVVLEADVAAALLLDLDDDGTVGDVDDLLLVQLAVNGGCGDDGGPGPVDPPVLTADVCVLLDANGDGVVLEADVAAALLLDLDDDGTIGDLDDLLLVQLAVNGGCGDDGSDDAVDADGTDADSTDADGTDATDADGADATDADGADATDADGDDGTDVGIADADSEDDDFGIGDSDSSDGVGIADADDGDTDAGNGDTGAGNGNGNSNGPDADDSDDSGDDVKVTSLPDTGQGSNDDGGSAIVLVFSLIGLVALAAATGWHYRRDADKTS